MPDCPDMLEITPTAPIAKDMHGNRAKCLQRLVRLDLPVPLSVALSFDAVRGLAQGRLPDMRKLSAIFGDESDIATGRTHLISWTYGLVDRLGDEPVGLRTPGGLTLGDQISGLREEFGSVALDEGDADLDIPPSFYVGPTLRGLATGIADDDYVLVIIGGSGCTG